MNHEKEKQVKRFSRGGLIIAAIISILSIIAILRILLDKSETMGVEPVLIWLIAGVALFFRSLRPPMGWKKGLVVCFGALCAGGSIIVISIPLRFNARVDFANIIVFFLFMIPGIFMLRSGFKKSKGKEGDSNP